MPNSLVLIALSIACGVGGQLALKQGMTQVGSITAAALAQPLQILIRVLTSPLVVVGLGLYVLGAAFWLTILSKVPLSLAYPLLAASYAITPILAWILLGENLPGVRWVGILTISLGVVLVARS